MKAPSKNDDSSFNKLEKRKFRELPPSASTKRMVLTPQRNLKPNVESLIETYVRLAEVTQPKLDSNHYTPISKSPGQAAITSSSLRREVQPSEKLRVDTNKPSPKLIVDSCCISDSSSGNSKPFNMKYDLHLTVLVSSSFLELYPLIVSGIRVAGDISVIDCPIPHPIDFIMDPSTALTFFRIKPELVEATKSSEKLMGLFKKLIQQLTGEMFKYSCIWLVIVHEYDGMSRISVDDYTVLYQSISQFPVKIVLREIWGDKHGNKSLGKHVDSNCSTAVACACYESCRMFCEIKACMPREYSDRPFLAPLASLPAFTAQAELLQLFPTVNFMLASIMLYYHNIKDLPLLKMEAFMQPEVAGKFLLATHAAFIEEFVQALNLHLGLKRYS
jgi:hypothetical protein